MKISSPIQSVCFDLGNVLVGFSHERMCRQMAQVCGVDQAVVRELLFDKGVQAEYESGRLNASGFVDRIRRELGVDVSEAALLEASNDIFWLNSAVIPIVRRLNEAQISTGILSNTCQGHWEFCCRQFPELKSLFRYTVLSFEVGCTKPDPAIYRRAIQAAGVPAEQILYLDDRSENVSGARDLGIQAVEFRTVADLQTALKEHEVIANL